MADSLIKIDTDGTFVVAGSVRCSTLEEAQSYLTETNVFTRQSWPFERRCEPRVTLVNVHGSKPDECFVVANLEF